MLLYFDKTGFYLVKSWGCVYVRYEQLIFNVFHNVFRYVYPGMWLFIVVKYNIINLVISYVDRR